MSGIDDFIDDYEIDESHINEDAPSWYMGEDKVSSVPHESGGHKHIFLADMDVVDRSYTHTTSQISWGQPAMMTQAKMDRQCPVCSARPNSAGHVFEIDKDGDGMYCHNCGWSA